MAPVQKFVDSFNKGDAAGAAATHAAGADLAIIDEVPPYSLVRIEGLQAWRAALEADAKKQASLNRMVMLSAPTRIENAERSGLCRGPAVYTFKQGGTDMREVAQMTFSAEEGRQRLADSRMRVDRTETNAGRDGE